MAGKRYKKLDEKIVDALGVSLDVLME